MNEAAAKILSDQIISSFQRIRALLFTSTLISAVIFANFYLEKYSIDEIQILGSSALKEEYENQILELKKQLRDAKSQNSQDVLTKTSDKLSELQAKVAYIDNSIKDYKLRTVALPAIGISIPANDLNVIGSIFLSIMSAWTLFTIHQIRDALFDPDLTEEIRTLAVALRHAAVFIYSPPKSIAKSLAANAMFAIPPLVIF